MKEIETEREAQQHALQERVARVTLENDLLRAEVAGLRQKIAALERVKSELQVSPKLSATSSNPTLTQVASPAPSPRREASFLDIQFSTSIQRRDTHLRHEIPR